MGDVGSAAVPRDRAGQPLDGPRIVRDFVRNRLKTFPVEGFVNEAVKIKNEYKGTDPKYGTKGVGTILRRSTKKVDQVWVLWHETDQESKVPLGHLEKWMVRFF